SSFLSYISLMTLISRSTIFPYTTLFRSTLLSVLERQGTECELVVVLRTRYDDPYHLRGEVRFVDMPARAGRVECLNAGIAKSSADRKSTRLNSSHVKSSYAVFCLKKKMS